jgi:hypothetical protein
LYEIGSGFYLFCKTNSSILKGSAKGLAAAPKKSLGSVFNSSPDWKLLLISHLPDNIQKLNGVYIKTPFASGWSPKH